MEQEEKDSDESSEAQFVRAERELKDARERANRVGYVCVGGVALGLFLFGAPFVSSYVLTGEAYMRARPVLEQRDAARRSADNIASLHEQLQQTYYNKL